MQALVLAALLSLAPDLEIALPDAVWLTPQEIEAFRAEALRGDMRHVERLIDHYAYIDNDPVEIEYWTRLHAEQGECGPVTSYWKLLKARGSTFRADEWAQRRKQACAALWREWGRSPEDGR